MAAQGQTDREISDAESNNSESEDELHIEADYDSDEMVEYVPSQAELLQSDSDSDDEDVPQKKRKRPSFRWSPRKRLTRPSTSTDAGPSTSAAPDTASDPDDPSSSPGQEDEAVSLIRPINFNKNKLRAKKGYSWSTTPATRGPTRTPARNIVQPFTKGPVLPQWINADSPRDCFELMFDDNIINVILKWTNQSIEKLAAKYKDKKTPTIDKAYFNEMMAFIGILIMSGLKQDNHVPTQEMFSKSMGPALYRAAMGERRFAFLLRALRFDDSETREERKRTDKFAAIREIFDMFINNCTSRYCPGENLTIDEQLIGFRGRCPFRMYIANKPAKYGLKLIMVCDSETSYMLNAMPYLGKHTQPPQGIPLGQYVTTKLVAPYANTNRNITGDNWFTSIPLTTDLLDNYGLTYIGTVRANKKEIPPEMTDKSLFKHGQSAFLFDKKMTLVTYAKERKKAPKKLVLLVSSQHDQPNLADNGKPEIIMDYNATKGGVDTFDQMCAYSSCGRMTKRWPLAVFFGMVNAAGINSYIIHNAENVTAGKKKIARRTFLSTLAHELIKPWAEERMTFRTQQRNIQQTIKSVFPDFNIPSTAAPDDTTKRRCAICPTRKDRKTKYRCITCHRPVCLEHSRFLCENCE